MKIILYILYIDTILNLIIGVFVIGYYIYNYIKRKKEYKKKIKYIQHLKGRVMIK